MNVFKPLIAALTLGAVVAPVASAHEAYVVSGTEFWNVLAAPMSPYAFTALNNPTNLHITIAVVVGVLIALVLNMLFRTTKAGQRFYMWLERFAWDGPIVVRATVSVALFFSAVSGVFLGPELHLSAFPYPGLVQGLLFAMSALFALGLFTEFAAVVGIILFLSSIAVFGSYLFTYINYLGEFIVLALFGMRIFSLDRYIFGPLRRWQALEKYETAFVRVLYGAGLMYAAITVKLLHPALTESVVREWNLTQFYWLFPSDPLLVTLGAGIVEAVIGLFIIVGFELRFTVLVSLFYLTLSLIYFQELVWPHLLLYGISISLLVQPETFTLDHLIFSRHRKLVSWWRRPFHPHTHVGKSGR